MSGESWWVAGMGDVQVDGEPRQERRWVAGMTEKCCDNERLLMGEGVVWTREPRNTQKRQRQVGRVVLV